MRETNRVLTKVGVVVGALSVMLAGCSATSNDANTAPDNDSSKASCTPIDGEINTVKDGVLTVAVMNLVPYASYNNGKPEGVDVDIIKHFADEECLNVDWQQGSYSTAIQSIANGAIDVAIGDVNRTKEREKVVDYSETIYMDYAGVASKTGIDTVKEMESTGKVGIVNGYLEVPDLTKILGNKLKTYPSPVELKNDFLAGRLDVAIDAYGLSVLQYADDKDVVVKPAQPDNRVPAFVRPPQSAIPLTKGNSSLKDALDGVILDMRKNDEIKKLLEKADLPDDLAGTPEQLSEVYSVG